MKKFLSVVLAVLMCVLPLTGNMTVAAAGAQATYTLSDDEGYAGDEITVDVELVVDAEFNTIGFAGLEYDEDALTFVKCSIDSELKAMCALTKFDKSKMSLVAAMKTEDDDGEPVPAPTEFDGLVCTLTFKINEDAPVGEYEITIADTQVKLDSSLLDTDVNAATVTVLGKDFDPALKFVDDEVEYDGEEHMIEVQNLPKYVDYEVEYTCDGEEFTGAVDAGEYEITAVVTAPGYNKFEETATLVIEQKEAVVNVTVPGKEYDGTTYVDLEDVEVEIEGLVNGDDVEVVIEELVYASKNAGKQYFEYEIYYEGDDAFNYTYEAKVPAATIEKKDVTVFVEDVTLMIGDTLPKASDLEYTVEPELVEGDELVGSLAFAKGANTKKEAEFAIIGAFAAKSNPNYNITVENGTLYVKDKTEQDIEVNAEVPADLTYGDEGFEIKITYGDVVSENDTVIESSDEDVVKIDGNNVVVVGAGKATVTVSKAGNEEIADFEEEIDVVVAKKEIVVTAKDVSKRIGSDDPELEYEYDESELVGDDAFTGELVRASGETAKEYAIKQGTLTLGDNYKIIFNEGTFTIFDKTPQVVEVVQSYNKTYGDESFTLKAEVVGEATDSAFEFSVVSGNNVSVDEDGVVTILGAGTAKIAVTKAGNADYADVSKTVIITVEKKEITITAVAAEKYVDEETPDLEYEYDESELVGDDVVTGELSVADGNKAGKTYAITLGSVKINDNYKIKYVGAVLTVLAKLDQELSFVAPEEATYTEEGLVWSVEIDGYYNEDADFEVVSGNTDVATVEEDGSIVIHGVGKTVITAKNAGNYMYNEWKEFVTLVVNTCPLVITVDDASKRIGNDDPVLTYSYESFNNEGAGIESGAEVDGMIVTLERKAGEALGNYAINAVVEIENEDCYDIKINKGTFSIIEKYPTNISVEKKAEAVYGVEEIAFAPVLDEAEEIGEEIAFKFVSDNEEVVSFENENEGTAKVNGIGKAVVTISYDGNDNYAGSTAKVEVTVSAKEVTVENVDLSAQTADVVGKLEGDDAEVDFSKVVLNVEETEYVVTNFVLVGEDADNYVVTTEEVRILIDEAGDVELVTVTDGGCENGTVSGLGSYLKGAVATLTAVPDKGYKFKCWIVNGEEVEGGATIELPLDEDTEVVAEFKKGKSASVVGGGGSTPERTITFVVDGDTYKEVTVEKGDKVKEPAAPEMEGFTFEGWYTDEACTNKYSFGAKVNSSMTLYAKFVEIVEEPEEEPKEETKEDETETEWTNSYADVKEEDWFYEAVKTVSEMGIMNGMKEGEFAPNVQLTRAMLVTMLYRIEGKPEVNGEVAYTDVNLGEYYGDALVWATESKIVNGVSETEFAPNANITREQIAAIIFRYAAFKGVEAIELSENLHFSDADKISDYAVAPMNWLVGKEILKGYEDGTIQPQGNATRAEVATIVTRILAFLG